MLRSLPKVTTSRLNSLHRTKLHQIVWRFGKTFPIIPRAQSLPADPGATGPAFLRGAKSKFTEGHRLVPQCDDYEHSNWPAVGAFSCSSGGVPMDDNRPRPECGAKPW